MSTLVIVAHPDLGRSRINRIWVDALKKDGRVTVRILSEELIDSHFDVQAEQAQLAGHERIVLQFPFHWYSCPPILKTWIDDVLEHGWAYGPGGTALEGKDLSIAVSTWSRADDYTSNGRYGRTMQQLTSPFEAIANRVGMNYSPGFFLNGVGDYSDSELNDTANALTTWLRSSSSCLIDSKLSNA